MRDLPWRRTRDPWAVLVSEVMLQQTQVPRVVPIWHAFMERFPTVRVCAAASQADVVRAWAGLGYNRRAVNLHRAAVLMGDAVPRDLDALLALPGIGAYTARAVLVFAFEDDVGLVETNIARVLSRRAGRRLSPSELQARGRRARARRSGVGVEPAPDGSRRARLHRSRPLLRSVAGCVTGVHGTASSGRLAGSRRSRGQTVRAVVGSSLPSASGTCRCTSSVP